MPLDVVYDGVSRRRLWGQQDLRLIDAPLDRLYPFPYRVVLFLLGSYSLVLSSALHKQVASSLAVRFGGFKRGVLRRSALAVEPGPMFPASGLRLAECTDGFSEELLQLFG